MMLADEEFSFNYATLFWFHKGGLSKFVSFFEANVDFIRVIIELGGDLSLEVVDGHGFVD
jgi:hypothetical protein